MCSAKGCADMTRRGFPHSDIHGSTLVCSSPWLFAAYHVLHRLLAPRHPPSALTSLTTKTFGRRSIRFAWRRRKPAMPAHVQQYAPRAPRRPSCLACVSNASPTLASCIATEVARCLLPCFYRAPPDKLWCTACRSSALCGNATRAELAALRPVVHSRLPRRARAVRRALIFLYGLNESHCAAARPRRLRSAARFALRSTI